jgi:hypothetical protein
MELDELLRNFDENFSGVPIRQPTSLWSIDSEIIGTPDSNRAHSVLVKKAGYGQEKLHTHRRFDLHGDPRAGRSEEHTSELQSHCVWE